MTAAELLLDLAERLTEADRKLCQMAEQKRAECLSVTFDGKPMSFSAAHLEAKAEGVRLALGYVNELRRMTGEDHS